MNATAPAVCNTFAVPAEAYDRLMGRYLPTLAPAFADVAGVTANMRVMDVGCGPGGLTGELVSRVGADAVAAIDPSPPFVEACRARNPGVDVRLGFAEQLPFTDASFDAALASLVVGFMTDAGTGVAEMARVTRPGGIVAACFWDYAAMPAIQVFWAAAATLDPSRTGEVKRLGGSQGDIPSLLTSAALSEVAETIITARADYADFDDWWSPFRLGVGPAGAYCQKLDPEHQQALAAASHDLLGRPNGPFTLEARAWCARGIV